MTHRKPAQWISTGVATLDAALGEGLPLGVIVELLGDEQSARRLALQFAASAQRRSLPAAYIDSRQKFNPWAACEAGVVLEKLVVAQPSGVEAGFQIAGKLIRSEVGLIVVDSELRVELDVNSALQARLAGRQLRELTTFAHRWSATVVVIAGDTRPSAETARPYVNALKFYSSLRCRVQPIERRGLQVSVHKNHFAPPFEHAEVAIEVQS